MNWFRKHIAKSSDPTQKKPDKPPLNLSEKPSLFEMWCFSIKISTFDQLQELILLEDFKACVPECCC